MAEANATFPRVEVQTGQVVFRAGDPGDRAYVIESGIVNIVRKVGGKPRIIARLSAGEIFGEMALVDGRRRMADAVVASTASLKVVPAAQLTEKIRTADPFIRAMLRMFVENLRISTRNALLAGDRVETLEQALRSSGQPVPPETFVAYGDNDTVRG